MTTKSKMTRRLFLVRGAGGAALGAGLVVMGSACGGGDGLNCTDVSGLSDAERSARTSLGYVEVSPHAARKNCTNCNFYTAGPQGQCGECTLVKGPINPNGYCNSWAAKT